jgi:DNA-binding transcriptional LysR family regulator
MIGRHGPSATGRPQGGRSRFRAGVRSGFGMELMGKLVRMPELVELRAFCAAVDLGSLSKAARLQQVSQPAISKRLQGLEGLVGSQLLERSTRGVVPTAAGRRLYDAARRLLTEAEAIEAMMEGLDAEQAPVRLPTSPTMAEFVLPHLLVELESRHEHHLSVELSIANSSAARTLVLEGRAELGLVAAAASEPPTPCLSELPFRADEIVVAVPLHHPGPDARKSTPRSSPRPA